MNKKILALVMLFALLASAIPISTISALVVPNPNTLTIATIGNAPTCDPAWAYDTASGELIFNVYETLLFFDKDSLEDYIPLIAESWPGSTAEGEGIIPSVPDPAAPDYTFETWYFKIRKGIKWQNPTYGNVTTEDVEYSIERVMVQDRTDGPAWMFFEPLLMGYSSRDLDLSNDTEAAMMGHMIDDAVQSNATHVWFNLMQGYAAFQQILTQTWASIVCKQWIIDTQYTPNLPEAHDFPGFDTTGYIDWRDFNDPPEPGPLMDEVADDPSFECMMGSGPYMLSYFDTDPSSGGFILDKFNNYWRGWSAVSPGHAHVNQIVENGYADWNVRKALFISEDPADQVDLCAVPRQNVAEIEHEFGIRYMYDLPTLTATGVFFVYNVNSVSAYRPTMGGVPKDDLFSDRHMRLAFEYAFNVTDNIESYWKGEAAPIGNPIVAGIAYYNASKPSRDIDIARVTQELQLAWGGQVWAQGFHTDLAWNTGNTARQTINNMIAATINAIKPGSVTVIGLPWATILSLVATSSLPTYTMGWAADYPDPHNWVHPFMHSGAGTFSGPQGIDYSLDPSSLDWTDYKYGGAIPYTNYAGDTVTELNNTYVDGLITTGIQIPNSNPLRQELYEELMDIFFAEAASLICYQPTARHYERTWVQGWYYNTIWPGTYFYELWKQDPATVKYDASIMWGSLKPGSIKITLHNKGNAPVYVKIKVVKITVNMVTCTVTVTFNGIVFNGWIYPCIPVTVGPFDPPGPAEYSTDNAFVGFSNWMDSETMEEITETTYNDLANTNNNAWPSIYAPMEVIGDLGGGVPPQWFAFDGLVTTKDLALFLMAFKGNGPF